MSDGDVLLNLVTFDSLCVSLFLKLLYSNLYEREMPLSSKRGDIMAGLSDRKPD